MVDSSIFSYCLYFVTHQSQHNIISGVLFLDIGGIKYNFNCFDFYIVLADIQLCKLLGLLILGLPTSLHATS